MKHKIIYIEWVDAHYDNGTQSTEEALKMEPFILQCAGMYVGETPDEVIYANEWCVDNGTWRYIHAIPKVNIIKKVIKTLK